MQVEETWSTGWFGHMQEILKTLLQSSWDSQEPCNALSQRSYMHVYHSKQCYDLVNSVCVIAIADRNFGGT
jgi:hypothetical protein